MNYQLLGRSGLRVSDLNLAIDSVRATVYGGMRDRIRA